MSKPRSLIGKTNEYPFRGQHQLSAHLKGCVPCTSIATATAARLLRMSDDDFFKTFNPTEQLEGKAKEHAYLQLSGCVQAGIDLNVAISKQDAGFFKRAKNLVTRKAAREVMEGIKKLDKDIGGVKDIELLDTVGVNWSDKAEIKSFYPGALNNFRDALFDEYKSKSNLDPSDIFFVATAANHTTAFFSRIDKEGNEYFYLTDSRDTFTNGKMEVHDSWQSATQSLLKKWSKAEYADISLLTTKDIKLRKETKLEVLDEKSQESNPTDEMESAWKKARHAGTSTLTAKDIKLNTNPTDEIESIWKKAKHAGISTLTTKDIKLPKETKDEVLDKKTQESNLVDTMDAIRVAINNYKGMERKNRLSYMHRKFGNPEKGSDRALSYLALLADASDELAKHVIILGLLSNDKSSQLRKAVSMELVFGDGNKDISNAKKEIEKSILNLLQVKKLPEQVKKAVQAINNYTDHPIPKAEEAAEKNRLLVAALKCLTDVSALAPVSVHPRHSS